MGVNDAGAVATGTLTAQWYNTVVTGLGLTPGTFQLIGPMTPLGATSDTLWSYFNDLPPDTLAQYQASGGDQFYSDYLAVVNALHSASTQQLQYDLGDCYAAWMKYVTGLTPLPTLDKLPGVFANWAAIQCAASATTGENDYEAMRTDPIAIAQHAVLDTSGFLNGTPDWDRTIADLTGELQRSAPYDFTFDSATASSDVSSAWAQVEGAGLLDFFAGEGSGDYSSLSAKAAQSEVKMTVHFDGAAVFSADPGGWYVASALGQAFSDPSAKTWTPGKARTWENTFGASGDMLRFAGSLVVVSGPTITMTVSAGFSSDEQQQITGQGGVSIWPFFEAKASGGSSSQVTFDDDGTMTVAIGGPTMSGLGFVLGVNVLPAKQYLTSGLRSSGG